MRSAPRRIATICTTSFRRHLEGLLTSLQWTNPALERVVYVDDAEAFDDLAVSADVRMLPEIRTLGVKRARFALYRAEIQRGPFLYLDSDVVVLEDLSPVWDRATLAACPDDLSHAPYIANRRYPWSHDPSLEAKRYINTGVLFFPASAKRFLLLSESRVRDDAFWNRYSFPPYLHDNHVFCALLNLESVELTYLDSREYNWPGFFKEGRFQVRRDGDSLTNLETGQRLRLVHFAGQRPIEAFLDAAPIEISSLIHERASLPKSYPFGGAIASLEATLSREMRGRDWTDVRVKALEVFKRELRYLGDCLTIDPTSESAFLHSRPDVLSVAWSVPNSRARWNDLQCGGAYLSGPEYNFLEVLLSRLEIRSVLESGCGETTILFHRRGLQAVAVESQLGPWLDRALAAGACGVHVPFSEGQFQEDKLIDALKRFGGQVDLIFIDSPVGTKARSQVLRQFLKHVGAPYVLYHDANRDAVNIFDDAIELGYQIIDRLPSERGLVLLGREPLTVRPSLQIPKASGARLSSYDARLCFLKDPEATVQGGTFEAMIHVLNRTGTVLSSFPPEGCPVSVSYHLLSDDGRIVQWDGERTSLPFDILHQSSAAFPISGTARPPPGLYQLEISLVQEGVTWFHEADASCLLRAPFEILPAATSNGDASS